ncbi:patatin-like phospholipase family protein [Winogradskyella pulchriflava]|uniref:Patatin-like phospholipase family protein n=1 Tax=Winogradskyella pulchriflava TaxID=1110688 RepID=A0ABV6QBP7_9FLAO
MSQSNTFHLGLTMAGAVSAGAYTAGFMDYILEALSEWEKAKQLNNDFIPNHNVVIDAIGGASAGGMVSMITTLALCDGNLKPVKERANTKTGNVLYDSWVFLDDDDSLYDGRGKGETTFKKMLSNSDLDNKKGAPSLLNSKPIDRIAESVFEKLPSNWDTNNLPNYVSDDLRVLLTITSLRPLDYKVGLSRLKSKFLKTIPPSHRISNHDIVAHFKLNYDDSNLDDVENYLPFRPVSKPGVSSNKDFLIKVTKATGAFPVGLSPRYFKNEFTKTYVQNSLSKRKRFTANMDIDFDAIDSDDFDFTAVDGGAINNEPFDEVLRCLKSNHGNINAKNPKYGTIMIDPFPNFKDEASDEKPNREVKSILDIVGHLVPTILNQARNKQSDTYGTDLFKLMAYPLKYKELGNLTEELKYPLATGAIGGFGGFLDIKFRQHDFFLGRKNAKNFLRGFLFLEYIPDDPKNLFYGVSAEAVEKFKKEDNGKIYMPIIPDVSKLDPNDEPNPSKYIMQEMPEFDAKAFSELKTPIKNRVKAILKAELKGKIDNWWLRQAIGLFRGSIAKKITNWVVDTIEKDFRKRGM